MQDNEKKDILKTIRFDPELISKIDAMRIDSERGFSNQVRFMLKEYIRIKEHK